MCRMETDSLKFLIDSLVAQKVADATVSTPLDTVWEIIKYSLDVVYKAGMVVIALVNIYFAQKIRKQQTINDEAKSTSDHKVMLLKTLILDYNLTFFYDSFNNLITITTPLKDKDADLKAIETQIQYCFKELNEGFIELLQGVDEELYRNVLSKSDETRDLIMNNMTVFKMDVEKVYEDNVLRPIAMMKKDIIKQLFEFK